MVGLSVASVIDLGFVGGGYGVTYTLENSVVIRWVNLYFYMLIIWYCLSVSAFLQIFV